MEKVSDILTKDDFIQEGSNPAPGVLILACMVGDDDENAKNRILVGKGNSWSEFALTGYPVCSVDAIPDGTAYVLDEGGALTRFNWRSPANNDQLKASRKLLVNDAAETRGPLRRVRVLGTDVVTAGTRGQIYRLRAEQFEALPRLSVKKKDLTLKDIAGASLRDMVAVTTEGYAAHFDGSKWTRFDLPSNVGLHAVCLLSDGRYAVAGNHGTVMMGRDDRWQLIQPVDGEDEGRTYYGIASEDTAVFVAYMGGVDFVDGNQLRAVKIADTSGLDFVRLTKGSDGVWAMAGHTVGTVSVRGGWKRLP